MVIGPSYVIGHIGKTAGDAVKQVVRRLRLPGVQLVPIDSPAKHRTFRQWGGDLSQRELVLSLRRLPAFVLSQFHHRLQSGRLAALPAAEQMCEDYMGDFYIRLYTDEGRLPVRHWLRSECVVEDLLDFLSRHHRLSLLQKLRARQARTKPSLSYQHDLRRFFGREQVQRLYEVNPLWAQLEAEWYGDLVSDHWPRVAA